MEVDQLLSLSGSALAQAISSILETPGLYVFSDILELPNVREVRNVCAEKSISVRLDDCKNSVSNIIILNVSACVSSLM